MLSIYYYKHECDLNVPIKLSGLSTSRLKFDLIQTNEKTRFLVMTKQLKSVL